MERDALFKIIAVFATRDVAAVASRHLAKCLCLVPVRHTIQNKIRQ